MPRPVCPHDFAAGLFSGNLSQNFNHIPPVIAVKFILKVIFLVFRKLKINPNVFK